MATTREDLFDLIEAGLPVTLKFWQDLVETESGSADKAGVDAAIALAARRFEAIGMQVRTVPYEKAGNAVVATWGDCQNKPFVLLSGHLDTVFPRGTLAQWPFSVDEQGRAHGPGCLDMKGGVAVAAAAAEALIAAGDVGMPIKFVFCGDEEVGHPDSDAVALFTAEAKGAVACFNMETGYEDGHVVVERKGSWQFKLETFGRGAHAGNDPENGRSAIREMAYKAIDIDGLTDWVVGNTFNVGTIEGGTVPNAVPDYCCAVVDMRFPTQQALASAQKQVDEVLSRTYVEGVTTRLTTMSRFNSMPRTEGSMKLFELLRETSRELGLIEPTAARSGGASDAAQMVLAGIPTLCSMGVRGGRNHTREEWALVSSVGERARLVTAMILKLSEGQA